jgi:hypothetical protein
MAVVAKRLIASDEASRKKRNAASSELPAGTLDSRAAFVERVETFSDLAIQKWPACARH